jgi:serine/threonine-protein kinase
VSQRQVGGRYRLHSMLGQGGTAVVWRGVDLRLDRPVAVKLLDRAGLADPTMLQRLDREARTVARLAHPNIVAMYDAGADDGVPYLVMELVDGDSLQAMLGNGPLDVADAMAVAVQICDALQAAHRDGVVHRDIKPANVLITPAGAVKVCDFGIARLQSTEHAGLTGPATAIGTSAYMAPEQASGDTVDARADLYALGCVLYAMLTGGPPFTGDSPLSVVWQHLHRPPAPVAAHRPGIPAALDALVSQLLAKNPADRPASAAEVRARLVPPPDQPPTPASSDGPTVTAQPAGTTRARAAVVARTQTMPALDPHDEPPTVRGVRLGRIGIAAVALGAAVLAALVVLALQTVGGSQPQAGSPATSVPPTNATGGPAERVNALRVSLQSQVKAGQLDADDAMDLSNTIDDIGRRLAKGELDKAAKEVANLRSNLVDLHTDNKITTTGYQALLSTLDQLANSLPPVNGN